MEIKNEFLDCRKQKSLIRNEHSFTDTELKNAIKKHGKEGVVQQIKAITEIDHIQNISFLIDMERSFFLDEQLNQKQFVTKILKRIDAIVIEEEE